MDFVFKSFSGNNEAIGQDRMLTPEFETFNNLQVVKRVQYPLGHGKYTAAKLVRLT